MELISPFIVMDIEIMSSDELIQFLIDDWIAFY